MCVSPSFVWVSRGPGHEKQAVPCRVCWRCRSNRVNDYVGRSLAEAQHSTATCAITLTYANDIGRDHRLDNAEQTITPAHFQNFIRALRKMGHSLRYIAAGEYGSKKGRVHFHALLFFQTPPPDWPQRENYNMPLNTKGTSPWPHGHVFCDWTGDERACRYVCKYILKYDDSDGWFTLSKKPSLGHQFFDEKAKEAARLGVMPSSFEYFPPGGSKGRSYLMTGATRRDYLAAIVRYRENSGNPADLTLSRGWHGKHNRLAEWTSKSVEKMQKHYRQKNAPKPCWLRSLLDMREALKRDALTVQQVARQLQYEDNRNEFAEYEQARIDRLKRLNYQDYIAYVASSPISSKVLPNGTSQTSFKYFYPRDSLPED